MKYLSFSTGHEMPILGLGTWKSAPNEVYQAVKEAIKIGYRHIDCAAIYGNEKEVGKAISEAITEGLTTREELWITSKLWNNAHGEENVRPALEKTLSDLELDYLDLYLIHWPVANQPDKPGARVAADFRSLDEVPLTDTWKGMAKAQEDGLARHIGVSNFNIHHLTQLLNSDLPQPEMNQVEMHPYLQQSKLVDFCQNNGIHLTAYSPLGSPDRPEGMKAEDEPILLQDPAIKAIAERKDASTAQVLLSWSIYRDIAVIPKSVNPKRLRENFAAAEVVLTEEEFRQIEQLNRDRRYVDGSFWEVEGGPYTTAELWGEL